MASARTCRVGARSCRAFSLVELVMVIGLLSLISATAIPTLSWMADARAGALRDECARQLRLARASALATGMPHGVSFDLGAGTLTLVRIESSGASPGPALGPTGSPVEPVRLGSRYGSQGVASVINGDGTSGDAVLWFGFKGTPEVRNASGVVSAPFAQDAVVTVSGGATIVVRRVTGAIE